MRTVKIMLPEALASELERGGYFEPEKIESLLRYGLRSEAIAGLRAGWAEAEADPEPPMTLEEIQAEINAYRAEKRLAAGA